MDQRWINSKSSQKRNYNNDEVVPTISKKSKLMNENIDYPPLSSPSFWNRTSSRFIQASEMSSNVDDNKQHLVNQTKKISRQQLREKDFINLTNLQMAAEQGAGDVLIEAAAKKIGIIDYKRPVCELVNELDARRIADGLVTIDDDENTCLSNNKSVHLQTSILSDRRQNIISNAQQIRARQYVTSMNIVNRFPEISKRLFEIAGQKSSSDDNTNRITTDSLHYSPFFNRTQ